MINPFIRNKYDAILKKCAKNPMQSGIAKTFTWAIEFVNSNYNSKMYDLMHWKQGNFNQNNILFNSKVDAENYLKENNILYVEQ